jgi:hypothetical protein
MEEATWADTPTNDDTPSTNEYPVGDESKQQEPSSQSLNKDTSKSNQSSSVDTTLPYQSRSTACGTSPFTSVRKDPDNCSPTSERDKDTEHTSEAMSGP